MERPDSGDQASESPAPELWIDRHLLPAIRDPALLPVVLVVVGHVVAFVTPALLYAMRERSIPSMLAIAAMAVLSAEVVRFEVRNRRKLTLSRIVVGTWLAAVAAAFAANHYQIL